MSGKTELLGKDIEVLPERSHSYSVSEDKKTLGYYKPRGEFRDNK